MKSSHGSRCEWKRENVFSPSARRARPAARQHRCPFSAGRLCAEAFSPVSDVEDGVPHGEVTVDHGVRVDNLLGGHKGGGLAGGNGRNRRQGKQNGEALERKA